MHASKVGARRFRFAIAKLLSKPLYVRAECAAMSAKSEALAKAKRVLRKFTGALSSPILIPSPKAEWGPLSPKSLEREIATQRAGAAVREERAARRRGYCWGSR